jgi:L-asparaginase II
VVKSIQAKTGVCESDFLFVTHAPYDRVSADALRSRGEAFTPNRHNCSGKHTGMLAYSHMLGIPYDHGGLDYIDPDHPVQKKIQAALAEISDLSPEQIHIGIDGCLLQISLPLQYSPPLPHMPARGIA